MKSEFLFPDSNPCRCYLMVLLKHTMSYYYYFPRRLPMIIAALRLRSFFVSFLLALASLDFLSPGASCLALLLEELFLCGGVFGFVAGFDFLSSPDDAFASSFFGSDLGAVIAL